MGFLGLSWFGLSWSGLTNYHNFSINAGGTVAAQNSISIDASGSVAAKELHSINAGGAVSTRRTYVIDAGGRVVGYREYSVNATGKVSQEASVSIDAVASIALAKTTSINATGKVATLNSVSINAIAMVIGWQTHTIDAGGTIAESKSADINAGGAVSIKNTASLLAISKVAQRVSTEVLNAIGFVASKDNRTSINATGYVTLAQTAMIYATGFVMGSPYYSLNSQDITLAMLEGLKSDGPEPKLEKLAYPGREDIKLIDQGNGSLEYKFDCFFTDQGSAFNYVNGVQLETGDGKFFPGDTLWFHKVRKVATERVKRRKNTFFVVGTRVFMEKPFLYSDIVQEWTSGVVNLPRTSGNFTNNGHYEAALDLLRITGHYYDSGRPKYLVFTLMDGVNPLSTIPLVDQLLSEEIIELDEDGHLTCSYSDDYATGTIFGQDAIASGASVAGGKVTITANGYFYYDFKGPWPLTNNMELQAILHIVQGTPYIDVSVDGGLTYNTAVYSTQMKDGVETMYYMELTAGYKDIRVRFKCGPSDILEVIGVEFTAVRRTKGIATPKIAAGTTRQIRISDGAGSTHNVSIYARYRDIRRAI